MPQLPYQLSLSPLSIPLMLDSTTARDHCRHQQWMVTSLSIHLPSISPSNVSKTLSLLAPDPHTLIPAVPTPVVSVSVPTGPLYEGTSQSLNCTATLAASVDTDITVSVHWTRPDLPSSSDRITISHPQTKESPFISTLTLSPLTRDDAGNYSCQVTATSSSPYITDSTPGESEPRPLTVTGVYVCANLPQSIIMVCVALSLRPSCSKCHHFILWELYGWRELLHQLLGHCGAWSGGGTSGGNRILKLNPSSRQQFSGVYILSIEDLRWRRVHLYSHYKHPSG